MNITPQEVGSFFLTLIVPIVTGVAAAWFTARFALNRFYHEKWWEKKHTAYNQLVDDLIELKSLYGQAYYYAEEEYNAGKNDKPRKGRTVDWKRYHQLLRQVQRHYVLAPISLSQSTKELLSRLIEKDADIEHNVFVDGYPEFMAYSDMSGETQIIIDAIVMDAEKELKFR